MGLDTTLFISNNWTLGQIQDLMAAKLGLEVSVIPTHTPEFQKFQFTTKTGEVRNMSVFTNSERGGFRGTLLSLGWNYTAQEILMEIAKVTGGFYQPQDSEDTFEAYDGMHAESSDMAFWVKLAAIKGRLDNKNPDSLVDFIKETKRGWKKTSPSLG